jgi:wyosine [tRNA(Phe)-imidazoG37] synthetase (radical SAM superfamily)
MPLPLIERIVYGPVRSRRLGMSLGVNLLPSGMKICNMNCAYCQYGWTRGAARYRGQGVGWPTPQAVETAVSERLQRAAANDEILDRVTVAGHGEPTLHPEFEEVVDRLSAARDRIAPALPIAVLSNSTTCMYDDVRNALRKIDERYMKLDGGDPFTLRNINATRVPIDAIVEGLVTLGPLTLQSMFVSDTTGRIENIGDGAVNEWLAAVERVNPIAVHLYTLGRGPALSSLRPASPRRLREIAEHVRAAGFPAHVYTSGTPDASPPEASPSRPRKAAGGLAAGRRRAAER